jgi:hypothetical protein
MVTFPHMSSCHRSQLIKSLVICYYATSQKVTGLITGFFYLRDSSWCKGWPACKAENLTAICEPAVYKMWELRRLANLWASTAYCDDFNVNQDSP